MIVMTTITMKMTTLREIALLNGVNNKSEVNKDMFYLSFIEDIIFPAFCCPLSFFVKVQKVTKSYTSPHSYLEKLKK